MQQQTNQDLDDTGKLILDDIYNQSNPIPYFSTLGELDYSIPEAARPVFAHLLETYRAVKSAEHVKILDLGCSYGVNAALLKSDMTLDDLYRHYDKEVVQRLDRGGLIRRDQQVFASDPATAPLEVIGLDAAKKALSYAEEAGILDAAVFANLEEDTLRPDQEALIKGTDLIVSTGCVGYISEKTIAKVLDVDDGKQPWMAHFVLRMFPFDAISDVLAERGYVTAKGSKPVLQRRFASDEEQSSVLERLIDLGIDPSGMETEGWFHADLYLSRPATECTLVPFPELTTI